MKKRIITSVIITVMFALIVVSCSFIALVNVKEIEQTKVILKNYNEIFIDDFNSEGINYNKFKTLEGEVRFTVVNKNGDVIFDTLNKTLENHGDREEIIEAFKNGQGTASRLSKSNGVNLVYVATKINDDYVLRSAVPIATIKVFQAGHTIYYVAVVIFVGLLSLGLSLKLIRAIIYPLKELEITTNKIASGDLDKRARIYTRDEIGSLAFTFNEMADQLQLMIKNSMENKNKLESILDSMESGVIALDNNFNILLINPYAKKLFGVKKTILGENIVNYIIDYHIINFVKEGKFSEFHEFKLLHPYERELRVKKAPIINNKLPTGIVIVIQDITDIKRLENMRSQFVANVSHELKTPLTSIKGFAETLRYVEDKETSTKFLDIIDKEAERLTRLINDILVLSNIENTYKFRVEEKIKVNDVIEEVISVVSNQANNNNKKIETLFEVDSIIQGDRDKMFQLLLNLVENAVKYSGEGTTILIKCYESKNRMLIQVKDNGIGIPKDDLPRIFERFYRVDKSRAKGGTGLGLAIVKYIVKLFNAEIFVDSKVGEGTVFTIKFKNYTIKDN